MKVCITGIAGFLGSWCAQKCIERGHDVHGVDNFTGGYAENIPPEARCYHADITDPKACEHGIGLSLPDVVIHCAAPAAEVFSHHARAFYYRQNVVGTANIVNSCVNHGVKVLAYTSSVAVYGDGDPPFAEEYSELSPIDPYGIAKEASENDIRSAGKFFGLNHVILRAHNVIGARQNSGDVLRNVASIFIRQALAGQPLTVFGDGTQRRAFSPVSYVADVIAASIAREETWNETYNLGSDVDHSVLDLAKQVIAIHGTGDIVHLPVRHEAHEAFCDHAKVRAAFPDLAPPEDIMDTLREMYEEAKSRPPRQMQPLPPIECAKNMPEVWKR